MPLAFESLTHGKVAFGFFNIRSDMLLLQSLFLFATEFCEHIREITHQDTRHDLTVLWEVFWIRDPQCVGDLMGAIHGIRYEGFIGELYRVYPFPKRPQDFKQRPDGEKTQETVKRIIGKYACRTTIPFSVEKEGGEAAIGPYRFSRGVFQELILYVCKGGYPQWREGIRPSSVVRMKEEIEARPWGLFERIVFD